MNNFNEYLIEQYGQIDESGTGMARVLKNMDSKIDFLFITAFRGLNSVKENIKRNNELIKAIRTELNQKAGAYKIIGHWEECSYELKDTETIKDCTKIINSLEETWLVLKPSNISSDAFNACAMKMAKKYNLDAYVIRLNEKLTLNGKDGTLWEDLGKTSSKPLTSGFQKISNIQVYSELKKLKNKGRSSNIVFENLFLVVPKDSNSSKMLFSINNFLF